jgi:uncharacterized protein (DUF58 family)
MPDAPQPLDLGPLLDALRGVRWPTRERVRAGMPGAHRASQRGTTGEFTEFRAYRQGDDPRRIDWRLLARSDRAFVRVTDERAWWPTWLLVDASASMAFPDRDFARAQGSSALDKWGMARALTVGLAAAAHATGDPVGLHVACRPDGRRLPARTRRGTVHAIANTLNAIAPSGAASLTPIITRAPVGARLVICTDMLGDTDALLTAIARARAAGSDVTLVHVLHPFEIAPPRGAWQAIDPEQADIRRPLTPESSTRYVQAFAAWRAEVARRCLSCGARHVEVVSDEPPARAVRRITGAAMRGAAA